MKVIFATDFYASSTTARALLMRLTWPPEARLELLHVLAPPGRVSLFAGRTGHSQDTLEAASRELRAFASDLAAFVEGSRGSVQYTIRVGDPGTSIVERAQTTEADLVVIGGPGRAEAASGDLSSLSATVIDESPCPVLVARTGALDRLVLLSDATPFAREVARWPLFRSVLSETVLSGERAIGRDASKRTATNRIATTDLVIVSAGWGGDRPDPNRREVLRSLPGSVLIARGAMRATNGADYAMDLLSGRTRD